jgi:hypothetical protein
VIDRAVMAYKGTETDVLYGVAIRPSGDGVIKGLKLTYYIAWRADATAHALLTRGFTF